MRQISTLVVDDDEGVRDAVAALLEIHGHQVEAVADAPQALESIRANAPDVVVCDYMLGNHTSLALAMTAEFRRVPVRVLLTGHEPDSLSFNPREPFTAVVEKTDGADALIAAIRNR